ncbi:hypothetical protein SLA2020_152270 [Shorea laevis]
MAATMDSLQPLFHALDPISLVLSQNSATHQPVPLRLTTVSYMMERGPRYSAYAELRESKLRMKYARMQEREELELKQTPSKKQVKFSPNLGNPEREEPELKQTPSKKQVKFSPILGNSRKGSSVLAQSVPDFSAALRKENRKPATGALELTPPTKNWSKARAVLSSAKGSKSANAGEKKGLTMARKSYACVEELKGISSAAVNAINGENRGGRSTRTGRSNKTVLGHRQY